MKKFKKLLSCIVLTSVLTLSLIATSVNFNTDTRAYASSYDLSDYAKAMNDASTNGTVTYVQDEIPFYVNDPSISESTWNALTGNGNNVPTVTGLKLTGIKNSVFNLGYIDIAKTSSWGSADYLPDSENPIYESFIDLLVMPKSYRGSNYTTLKELNTFEITLTSVNNPNEFITIQVDSDTGSNNHIFIRAKATNNPEFLIERTETEEGGTRIANCQRSNNIGYTASELEFAYDNGAVYNTTKPTYGGLRQYAIRNFSKATSDYADSTNLSKHTQWMGFTEENGSCLVNVSIAFTRVNLPEGVDNTSIIVTKLGNLDFEAKEDNAENTKQITDKFNINGTQTEKTVTVKSSKPSTFAFVNDEYNSITNIPNAQTVAQNDEATLNAPKFVSIVGESAIAGYAKIYKEGETDVNATKVEYNGLTFNYVFTDKVGYVVDYYNVNDEKLGSTIVSVLPEVKGVISSTDATSKLGTFKQAGIDKSYNGLNLTGGTGATFDLGYIDLSKSAWEGTYDSLTGVGNSFIDFVFNPSVVGAVTVDNSNTVAPKATNELSDVTFKLSQGDNSVEIQVLFYYNAVNNFNEFIINAKANNQSYFGCYRKNNAYLNTTVRKGYVKSADAEILYGGKWQRVIGATGSSSVPLSLYFDDNAVYSNSTFLSEDNAELSHSYLIRDFENADLVRYLGKNEQDLAWSGFNGSVVKVTATFGTVNAESGKSSIVITKLGNQTFELGADTEKYLTVNETYKEINFGDTLTIPEVKCYDIFNNYTDFEGKYSISRIVNSTKTPIVENETYVSGKQITLNSIGLYAFDFSNSEASNTVYVVVNPKYIFDINDVVSVKLNDEIVLDGDEKYISVFNNAILTFEYDTVAVQSLIVKVGDKTIPYSAEMNIDSEISALLLNDATEHVISIAPIYNERIIAPTYDIVSAGVEYSFALPTKYSSTGIVDFVGKAKIYLNNDETNAVTVDVEGNEFFYTFLTSGEYVVDFYENEVKVASSNVKVTPELKGVTTQSENKAVLGEYKQAGIDKSYNGINLTGGTGATFDLGYIDLSKSTWNGTYDTLTGVGNSFIDFVFNPSVKNVNELSDVTFKLSQGNKYFEIIVLHYAEGNKNELIIRAKADNQTEFKCYRKGETTYFNNIRKGAVKKEDANLLYNIDKKLYIGTVGYSEAPLSFYYKENGVYTNSTYVAENDTLENSYLIRDFDSATEPHNYGQVWSGFDSSMVKVEVKFGTVNATNGKSSIVISKLGNQTFEVGADTEIFTFNESVNNGLKFGEKLALPEIKCFDIYNGNTSFEGKYTIKRIFSNLETSIVENETYVNGKEISFEKVGLYRIDFFNDNCSTSINVSVSPKFTFDITNEILVKLNGESVLDDSEVYFNVFGDLSLSFEYNTLILNSAIVKIGNNVIPFNNNIDLYNYIIEILYLDATEYVISVSPVYNEVVVAPTYSAVSSEREVKLSTPTKYISTGITEFVGKAKIYLNNDETNAVTVDVEGDEFYYTFNNVGTYVIDFYENDVKVCSTNIISVVNLKGVTASTGSSVVLTTEKQAGINKTYSGIKLTGGTGATFDLGYIDLAKSSWDGDYHSLTGKGNSFLDFVFAPSVAGVLSVDNSNPAAPQATNELSEVTFTLSQGAKSVEVKVSFYYNSNGQYNELIINAKSDNQSYFGCYRKDNANLFSTVRKGFVKSSDAKILYDVESIRTIGATGKSNVPLSLYFEDSAIYSNSTYMSGDHTELNYSYLIRDFKNADLVKYEGVNQQDVAWSGFNGSVVKVTATFGQVNATSGESSIIVTKLGNQEFNDGSNKENVLLLNEKDFTINLGEKFVMPALESFNIYDGVVAFTGNYDVNRKISNGYEAVEVSKAFVSGENLTLLKAGEYVFNLPNSVELNVVVRPKVTFNVDDQFELYLNGNLYTEKDAFIDLKPNVITIKPLYDYLDGAEISVNESAKEDFINSYTIDYSGIYETNAISEQVVTITPKYKTYTLDYLFFDGFTSTLESLSYTKLDIDAGTVVFATAPARTDLKFAGWYYNGKLVESINDVKFINGTLYGVYVEDKKVVTFVSGTENFVQDVEIGGTTVPQILEKEGYVFEGWYTDEAFTTKFDFSTQINSDVTLYAKWTEISTNEGVIVTPDATIDNTVIIDDENKVNTLQIILISLGGLFIAGAITLVVIAIIKKRKS